MSDKTPITVLNELCMQAGTTLVWENIKQPTDPLPPFVCRVEAFDVEAFATAQSKKQAKHEACAQLIGKFGVVTLHSRIKIDSFPCSSQPN